jgi:hypothetical protein
VLESNVHEGHLPDRDLTEIVETGGELRQSCCRNTPRAPATCQIASQLPLVVSLPTSKLRIPSGSPTSCDHQQ